MKRFGGLLALMTLVSVAGMSLGGCASVQKKFTRVKKEEAVRPVVFTEENYVKPYSNSYYYQARFNDWKGWHDELMSSLGQNSKREERCSQEALSNLEKMCDYLTEPKKGELTKEVAVLKNTLGSLLEKVGAAQRANFKQKLERSRRIIGARFDYNNVKDAVLPDKVDL